MDFVVSGGTDPDQPIAPPRQRDPLRLLVQLIAAGVALMVVGIGFVGWTAYQTQKDNRVLNCTFLISDLGAGNSGDSAALVKREKAVADRFGCDMSGH